MKLPRGLVINGGAGEEQLTDGQIYALTSTHLNNRTLIGDIGRRDAEGSGEVGRRNLFTLPRKKKKKQIHKQTQT